MNHPDEKIEWAETLRVSPAEEFVAEQFRRISQGLNGENYRVAIRHTRDGGATWELLPWRKNPFSPGAFLMNWWPPAEYVNLSYAKGRLHIEFLDEDATPVRCRASYNPKFRWWWIYVPRPFFGRTKSRSKRASTTD